MRSWLKTFIRRWFGRRMFLHVPGEGKCWNCTAWNCQKEICLVVFQDMFGIAKKNQVGEYFISSYANEDCLYIGMPINQLSANRSSINKQHELKEGDKKSVNLAVKLKTK